MCSNNVRLELCRAHAVGLLKSIESLKSDPAATDDETLDAGINEAILQASKIRKIFKGNSKEIKNKLRELSRNK